MAPAEGLASDDVVLLDEALDQFRSAFQLFRLGETRENLRKFRLFGAAQKHLVLDTAQKRFIAQLVRTQVGRENKKRLERNRHLSARMEAQIIDVPLHGDDPA